jgi:hypothetical protein
VVATLGLNKLQSRCADLTLLLGGQLCPGRCAVKARPHMLAHQRLEERPAILQLREDRSVRNDVGDLSIPPWLFFPDNF